MHEIESSSAKLDPVNDQHVDRPLTEDDGSGESPQFGVHNIPPDQLQLIVQNLRPPFAVMTRGHGEPGTDEVLGVAALPVEQDDEWLTVGEGEPPLETTEPDASDVTREETRD